MGGVVGFMRRQWPGQGGPKRMVGEARGGFGGSLVGVNWGGTHQSEDGNGGDGFWPELEKMVAHGAVVVEA